MASTSAQVSGSATVVSDYRFRGLSLSDGQPSAQLGVAYDGRGGWYAGAMTAGVRPEGSLRAQLLAYAGFARPLRPGLNWDVGAQYSTVAGDGAYRYAEAYLGVSAERYSLRLSYARHYLGQDAPALYASFERAWPLSERLRLLGHLGLLRRNGRLGRGDGRYREDARLGLGLSWHHLQWQLAWTLARGSEEPYPFGYAGREPARQGWVLSCSRSW